MAKIYKELGLDHGPTREAARALELDYLNEASHRRLYYSLRNMDKRICTAN